MAEVFFGTFRLLLMPIVTLLNFFSPLCPRPGD
jgi:hypothetical protein